MPAIPTQTICFAIKSDRVPEFYELLNGFQRTATLRHQTEDANEAGETFESVADFQDEEAELACQIVDILTELP